MLTVYTTNSMKIIQFTQHIEELYLGSEAWEDEQTFTEKLVVK